MYSTDASIRDSSRTIRETPVATAPCDLLPANYRLHLDEKVRMISLFRLDPPQILAQQQLTRNEWCILQTLLVSHPYYAPYEMLLASLTSLSPAVCRERIYQAQQSGSKALKQELKPVYRALAGLRVKLSDLSPNLRVFLIRDLGYALTNPSLMTSERH